MQRLHLTLACHKAARQGSTTTAVALTRCSYSCSSSIYMGCNRRTFSSSSSSTGSGLILPRSKTIYTRSSNNKASTVPPTQSSPSSLFSSNRTVLRGLSTGGGSGGGLLLPKTKVSTTSTGIRVASEYSESETACIGVWIDAGSRYETIENNGTAHFLEHLAFKGTSRRSREGIEVEIENMGGHLNAYTSREQTVYYAKCFHKDVPKAFEIIADILTNSTLDPKAIEREREVILREMEEVNKIYEEQILDRLHLTAFMGSPLSRTILGPEENIRSIQRKHLEEYIGTHYTANRFVIAGAGNVDQQQLIDLTEQHFGKLPKQSKYGKPIVMEPAVFTGSDSRLNYSSMAEAHVAIAFQGASWTSEYAFPLMLMQTILGFWDRSSSIGRHSASKFAHHCADKELCYSYMTFNTCYKDTGLFGMYMVAPPDKLEDATGYALESIMRLCYEVSEQELERAKTQLKANMLMQLDSHSQVAEDIGRQLLTYGRRMGAAEIFSRINAITVDDIKATANYIFNDEDHALVGIGPIQSLPAYNWIRKRTIINGIPDPYIPSSTPTSS